MQANLGTLAATGIAVAVAHDRDAAGSQVALPLGFVEALESAISDLRRHMLTGTLRFAQRQERQAPALSGFSEMCGPLHTWRRKGPPAARITGKPSPELRGNPQFNYLISRGFPAIRDAR